MEPSLRNEPSSVTLPCWQPGLVWVLLLSYFGLLGILIGVQGVLWAEVMQALQLSEGTFGSAQLVSPLLSVGVLLQGGPLCAWAGKKRLALMGLLLLAISTLALAGAMGLGSFVAALALSGAGMGLLEVAMNGATMDWEQATGRNAMNVMHAGFSGGAVLGAIAAGWLLTLGWSYGHVFALLTLLGGLASLATWPVRYPLVDAAPAGLSGLGATLRLLLSRRALVLMALLCLLGVAAESVAYTWSVIYLRQLGAEAAVGGMAFALFNGAMFVGRLANAPLVARLGPQVSLTTSGLGLVLAALLLLVPGQVPPTVVAFVLMGLAVAGVVPTVLSAATPLTPGHSGAIAGGLMAAAYVGFVLCAPLVGWLAEFVSLQVALLSGVGLSGLAVVGLARRLGKDVGQAVDKN